MLFRLTIISICSVFLLFQGCNNATTDAPPSSTEKKNTKKDSTEKETLNTNTEPAPPGQTEPKIEEETKLTKKAVSLKPGDWKTVLGMVKANPGKVVVVDLWALTCLPCRREFPHLVELQEKYKKDVVCISVNCDFEGSSEKPLLSYEDDVRDFLFKKKANFDNIQMATPYPDFFRSISVQGIPVIYVFNQKGEMVKRFDNSAKEFEETGFTYKDHVLPLIAKLLEKPNALSGFDFRVPVFITRSAVAPDRSNNPKF